MKGGTAIAYCNAENSIMACGYGECSCERFHGVAGIITGVGAIHFGTALDITLTSLIARGTYARSIGAVSVIAIKVLTRILFATGDEASRNY